MISAINSSDNKRHMAFVSAGGLAWGGKEVYNTIIHFQRLKKVKIYIKI